MQVDEKRLSFVPVFEVQTRLAKHPAHGNHCNRDRGRLCSTRSPVCEVEHVEDVPLSLRVEPEEEVGVELEGEAGHAQHQGAGGG